MRSLRNIARLLAFCVAIAAGSHGGAAQDVVGKGGKTLQNRLPPGAIVELAARPGHISIMRHALAPFDGAPPAAGSRLEDCATQRNLDAIGRADASRIGGVLRAKGLAFEHTFTSPWCRCQETADLIAGRKVAVAPWLDSFFRKPENGPQQLADLRQFVHDLPPGDRALLVTHGSLILSLTGLNTAEAEIVVFVQDAWGSLQVVARGVP